MDPPSKAPRKEVGNATMTAPKTSKGKRLCEVGSRTRSNTIRKITAAGSPKPTLETHSKGLSERVTPRNKAASNKAHTQSQIDASFLKPRIKITDGRKPKMKPSSQSPLIRISSESPEVSFDSLCLENTIVGQET